MEQTEKRENLSFSYSLLPIIITGPWIKKIVEAKVSVSSGTTYIDITAK